MSDCDRVVYETERAANHQEMRRLQAKECQLDAVIDMCKQLPGDSTAQAILALIRATREQAY